MVDFFGIIFIMGIVTTTLFSHRFLLLNNNIILSAQQATNKLNLNKFLLRILLSIIITLRRLIFII